MATRPAEGTLRVYRQGESVVIAGADGEVTARFYDIAGRQMGVFSGNGSSFTIPVSLQGAVIISVETEDTTAIYKLIF